MLFVLSAPAPNWLKLIDQGGHDPRLKGYKTPAGIKLEIVAEAPVVVNPIGMAFAVDGTPYVLEWRPGAATEAAQTITYKDGSTRKARILRKPVKDVVKALGDTTGKGTYDKATVLLEEELPSSILLQDGWLYLVGQESVRRYKQSKPGGPYDIKEVVAQGFSGTGQPPVSGMSIGPDGSLYISCGDGDHVVEGPDGSRAVVLRSGAVFRCRPDGSKLAAFAFGLRHPSRDGAFDAASNLFQVDHDTDYRLRYVAEGNDFGWRRKVSPPAKAGQKAASGLLSYDDSRFPDLFRGLIFYPDPRRQTIRAYRVERDGAGFVVGEEFEFLKSDDPLFRPCQMVLGPDGAMYIVDWRTSADGVGQPGGDGKNGRIYRVTWAGTTEDGALPRRGMDSWEKITRLDDEELLKSLASENASDRAVARAELRRRGEKNRPALLKLLDDGDQPEHARLAALGVLGSFWNVDVQKECEEVLGRGGSDLRRQSAEALGLNTPPGNRDVMASLLRAMADPDPAVRRATAQALARVGKSAAADSLANTIAFDNGKDGQLTEGYIWALESLGQPGIERLLAVADSGVPKDLDRVVDVFTALHTRPAVEALPALLKNPHLSIGQRARLVASWNNYLLDPPVSLEPCFEYLTANPEAREVKLAGLSVLTTALTPPGEKGSAWMLSLLDETDAELRVAALKAIEQTRLARASDKVKGLLLDNARAIRERQAAARALGTEVEGARLVGKLFLEGKLPADLRPQVVEVLRQHTATDKEVGQLLAEVEKMPK
jgi:glucose/arabinose dehydrogenase/HEAT repeat protein